MKWRPRRTASGNILNLGGFIVIVDLDLKFVIVREVLALIDLALPNLNYILATVGGIAIVGLVFLGGDTKRNV